RAMARMAWSIEPSDMSDQLPVSDHDGVVDAHRAVAHGDVEVRRCLPAGEAVRPGRPHEVPGGGSKLLAVEAAGVVHIEGRPTRLRQQAPPHVAEGPDLRVVPRLEVVIEDVSVRPARDRGDEPVLDRQGDLVTDVTLPRDERVTRLQHDLAL